MHNDLQNFRTRAKAALRTISLMGHDAHNVNQYARSLDRLGTEHDLDLWLTLKRGYSKPSSSR
jgi:hypothetical protein